MGFSLFPVTRCRQMAKNRRFRFPGTPHLDGLTLNLTSPPDLSAVLALP